jgi:hypothetical protein
MVGRNGRVLGASILGAGAGDLILPWALAISQKLKSSALANLIVPYPTRSRRANALQDATMADIVLPTHPPLSAFSRALRLRGDKLAKVAAEHPGSFETAQRTSSRMRYLRDGIMKISS